MARPTDDSDADDAALRWDDVDDASYDLGPQPGAAPEDSVSATTSAGAAAPADRGRTALVATTGVFGGVYLMYAVGWVLGVAQLRIQGADLLQEITYQFAEFLAIIAAPVWFVATLVLTRGRRAVERIGWLALGALMLVPWPFLLGVIR